MFILKIYSYYLLFNGYYISLIIVPIFNWLFASSTIHDSLHFSIYENKKLNKIISYLSPEFSIPTIWYIQHNINHHINTNILNKDPDIYHSEFILRKTYDVDYKLIHSIQYFFGIFIELIFTHFGLVIYPLIKILLHKNNIFKIIKINNDLHKEMQYDVIIYTLYMISVSFLPFILFNAKKALLFCFIPKILFSILFWIHTQLTHIHDETLGEKQKSLSQACTSTCEESETLGESKTLHLNIDHNDWYKNQVETAIDFATSNIIISYISGGTNCQISHHLFPNINACHLPQITNIVEKICKKHDINYKKFNGYYDAFRSYYKHIIALSYKNKK